MISPRCARRPARQQRRYQRVLCKFSPLVVRQGRDSLHDARHTVSVSISAPRQPDTAAEIFALDLPVLPDAQRRPTRHIGTLPLGWTEPIGFDITQTSACRRSTVRVPNQLRRAPAAARPTRSTSTSAAPSTNTGTSRPKRTISRDEATASTLRDYFARSSPMTSTRSPPMARQPRHTTHCLTIFAMRSGSAQQRFATAPTTISDGAPQLSHSTTQPARLTAATSARTDQ